MKKFLFALFLSFFAAPAQASVITLTPSNTIALRSEVTDETVSQVIMKLFESNANPVYIYINSPGGSILAGNDLIQAIKSSGKKVICIANFAASMAFSILQNCDTRLVTESAILMQHEASYRAGGSISENRKTLEFIQKIADKLNADDAKRIGMPVDDFKLKIRDEWWLFNGEIVKSGAADSETGVVCSPALTKMRDVQVIESLFGKAVVTWSACPLVSYPVSVEVKMKLGVDIRDFQEWTQGLDLDQDWKSRRETR